MLWIIQYFVVALWLRILYQNTISTGKYVFLNYGTWNSLNVLVQIKANDCNAKLNKMKSPNPFESNNIDQSTEFRAGSVVQHV